MSLTSLSERYESDYGDELWFGGDGHGLISVGEWNAGGCKKDRPEDWAELVRQAHLISASQDLLDALEGLMESPLTGSPTAQQIVDHWQYEKDQGNGYAEPHLKALAAIARAKGESS